MPTVARHGMHPDETNDAIPERTHSNIIKQSGPRSDTENRKRTKAQQKEERSLSLSLHGKTYVVDLTDGQEGGVGGVTVEFGHCC